MGIRLEARQMLRELISGSEGVPQQIFSERLNPTIEGSMNLAMDLILAASRRAVKITKRGRKR